MLRKTAKLLLLLCLILMMAVSAAAAPAFRLEVCPSNERGKPIKDVFISACKVATLQDGEYALEQPFQKAGISMPTLRKLSASAAQDLYDAYVAPRKVIGQQQYAAEGAAAFDDLEAGIWLVWCPEGQAYRFNPFLVSFEEQGGTITSRPKGESNAPNSKIIQVVKKWEDNHNAAGKRPEEIVVLLRAGKKTVAKATLSESTGWSHTFEGLNRTTEYTVAERAVKNYRSAVNGDAQNGFVVTNTYEPPQEELPETGQHWIPILLIAIAGISIVILGIYELRCKNHEK